VWTKRADAHLMEVAARGDIAFAASPDGGYIWPAFLPAYDAAASLAHLLDLLAATDRPLSAVVKTLPRVHVAHESVPTPWERKGGVMRELVEQLERSHEHDVLLVDGVKVLRPDGWALMLPDLEQASTHVWAESDSDEAARRLAREYARVLRQLLR
jgi:mannose-1-phosphate guanylyltransferase / phosphomannomutase